MYLNQSKNGKEIYPVDYLDSFSSLHSVEENILGELIAQGGNEKLPLQGVKRTDPLNSLQFYRPEVKEIYGGLKWYSGDLDLREWLKRMSIFTKEPCFTSYTNIKLPVDYIFYQGEDMEVARVLDLPSFNRYLKDNIECLPHPLMPSDHFSIVADFLIK